MRNKRYLGTLDHFLNPKKMISLYRVGAFPMADDDLINWYLPQSRAIIFIDSYNIPRSLNKFISTCDFEIKFDTNVLEVIKNCANREPTWISEKLIKAYQGLLELGYLHSAEVYKNNELVGGLYGIAIKGAFFGESMFSKIPQASKFALTMLLHHLKTQGFTLVDVQFMTEHLKMFGAKEITYQEFQDALKISYSSDVKFL